MAEAATAEEPILFWQDRLHLEGKGSFRKVEFYVDDVSSSVGRRTVVHEYPGTDHVEVEDLGRQPRRFSFNAYFVGPRYMEDRDTMREAVEKSGPGPLVHPYWGDMTVVVDQVVQITETTSEGGMCRFTLSVIVVSEDIPSVARPAEEDGVDEEADAANAAAAEDFEDDFTVADAIDAVSDAAQTLVDGVNGVTSTLNKANGYVKAAMNVVDDIGDSITAIADAAATLIAAPGALVDAVEGAVGSITSAIDTVTDAWDEYFDDDETAATIGGSSSIAALGGTPASGDERAKALMKVFRIFSTFGDEFDTVDETTDQREIQAKNQSAMTAYMRMVGVSETCRSASKIPFVSYDQAVAVRDELSDELDALAETANDISYAALVNLRAATIRYLNNASSDLPRVISYTPAKTIPALVIAHQLYADSKRDMDIIDRNGIRNPCRVPGGDSLEVISDE